jgi:DNA-binding MarR family transcriptional regulator
MSSASASGTPDPPDLAAAFGTFVPTYLRHVRAAGGECGPVTYARARLLGLLRCASPQTMRALSDGLGVTPRNVTALVDALEADGLVERRPHPTDRRATLVALTDAGDAVCGQQLAGHQERAAQLFAVLEPDERAELLRLISRLQAALEEAGGASA